MRSFSKRLIVLVLSVMLVLSGSGVPSLAFVAREESGSAVLEPVGTPWQDWFVRSLLTKDDEVRLEDDFYTAMNRDMILAYNNAPLGPASVAEEREDEITDQMVELITGKAAGDGKTSHDLACLRTLYDLYTDWDARDEDGIAPVEGIIDRLLDIESLDQLADWYCSDDFRLSMAWRFATEGMSFAARGVSLFGLSAHNEVEGEKAGAYVVSAYAPEYKLSPFCWSDEAVYTDGEVDPSALQELRDAATYADKAHFVLRSLGFSKKEAHDIAYDAARLENKVDVAIDAANEAGEVDAKPFMDVESLTHAELEARCKGGFPLDRIIDAYGYGDAAEYEIDGSTWLDAMNALYTEDNLDLFVSHALVSIALESSTLLDSAVDAAARDADGDRYLSDELLKAVPDEGEGPDEVNYDDATDEQVAQWDRRDGCKYAREAAPTSYAKAYAQHYYDERISKKVEEMVHAYLEAYEQMLADEDWISQKTRDAAIEKLQAMRIQVGHPEAWPDTASLKVRSRAEGGTLFSETRRVAAYDLEQELYLLHHPDEGDYWRDCMDVNAAYDPTTNSVTIGMGILGGVYWPKDGSYEEQLAGIGVTIGHEISHAFDSHGAYFDKNGGYEQWWTDEDLEAFQKRVERVKACFSGIDPLGRGCYDGGKVCGEAIADMGGLKVTMLVASERRGFDYDEFFRAYALSWASILSVSDVTYQLANDGHPLDRDRVNVPVREVDEFYDTYDIAKDDGMWLDPSERVSVW